MPEVESEMPMGANGKFRDPEWRCQALWNPGVWPYGKRCDNDSTVTTADGSHYCNLHEGYGKP